MQYRAPRRPLQQKFISDASVSHGSRIRVLYGLVAATCGPYERTASRSNMTAMVTIQAIKSLASCMSMAMTSAHLLSRNYTWKYFSYSVCTCMITRMGNVMSVCSHDDDSLTCLSVFFLRLIAHSCCGQVVLLFAKCHRYENAILYTTDYFKQT